MHELMIEADKCDLVCANCDAIRTAGNPAISANIREAKLGVKPSQETREKMSMTRRQISADRGGPQLKTDIQARCRAKKKRAMVL